MLSAFMLNVVMLSVVAPSLHNKNLKKDENSEIV
jgi:hypothetical protein